ncbi:Hsp20/alpha crystallin family protein [Nodosilinea sp. LEGE 07298]|uniref:Hsp20/alpha crystallin family protein n=1 Tax=Nodosilinea sp. LEGE 07298 TaxID=2777970 RepID=UPI00187FD07B|nr:Hsp20/alpha crystallin family protein [Nodosilinea sp. LEGE 07298]MBE9111265.1 Hsp20/alpha crystallin family protein [Nodosilinea sp. LEGE 07298]
MAIMQRDSLDKIAHWEPFRGIEQLHQEMNHLFDRLMQEGNGGGRSLTFIPSAEMEETDQAIQLKLEVPGLEAKDLDVEVTDSTVSIKGERKSKSKTEEKGIVRSEFRYGTFERVIPLPASIQTANVQANYKNGLLTLILPKVESAAQSTVKVPIS